MAFIYSSRTCLRRRRQRKPAKSRPPIPTNTHLNSCWNLLLTARMLSSTFITITSPRLTYEICSSLPVLECSYEPLWLVGEQFKPCARPYWSRNDTCMSSSPLAILCKVHLPRKVKDQILRRSWRTTRLWTTCARPSPFSPRSMLWSSNINPIRCPFPRWCPISTTYPKSTRRSCPTTLSHAKSSST